MRTVLLALAALALAIACGGSSDEPVLSGEVGTVYLALGDSIAEGENASDRERSGYVALVHQALIDRFGSMKLVSLARGGHTTQDLIDQQLDEALALLRDTGVAVVTITVGGNDLYVLAGDPNCLPDPSIAACGFEDIVVEAGKRLNAILGELRAAAPNAVLVIQYYPDLFSGTGHEFEDPAAYAFGRLNEEIEAAAEAHRVLLADPRDAFDGRGGQLTSILDPEANFHPNDAGHAAIAAAFLQVLGLD